MFWDKNNRGGFVPKVTVMKWRYKYYFSIDIHLFKTFLQMYSINSMISPFKVGP